MKRILVSSALILAIITGCDKDKFESTPTLKILEIPEVVSDEQPFQVRLEFTDKEGDVFATNQNLNLILIRERLNLRGKRIDSVLRFAVPPFPQKSKGEILLNLSGGGFTSIVTQLQALEIPGTNPREYEPDTLRLGFVLKDTIGNKSDTPRANIIVIR